MQATRPRRADAKGRLFTKLAKEIMVAALDEDEDDDVQHWYVGLA